MHYSSEREGELHWREGICLRFVGERLQGDRGGFYKGNRHTSSAWQRPLPSGLRASIQGDAEADAGVVLLRRGSNKGKY